MALKKYKDYIGIQQETLLADLHTAEVDYNKTKLEHSVKGLANPTELRYKRKEIAMMKTELRKRELAQMSAEQLEKRSKLRYRRSAK